MNHGSGTILPRYHVGWTEAVIAGGLIIMQEEVSLTLQLIGDDGETMGATFIENCLVEAPSANTVVGLLSGLGIRTRYF